MRRAAGFTLFELLIVLAIVAILLGMFSSMYVRNIRAAELRDAAAGVAADLRAARSRAQRASSTQVVSWAPGDPVGSYVAQGTTRTLPGGITLACVSGCTNAADGNRVTYLSPYGELSADGGVPAAKILRVYSPVSGIAPLEIRTVGVTGKVLLVSTRS